MSIIQLVQTANRADQPLVCFLDLQVEYVAEGRALALEAGTPWMENCRRLLALARAERMSIAHFRQLRRGTVLNPATGFANWIEEFRPRPSEMVFERALPSCYAAEKFASVLDYIDHPIIVLAGLTGHGGDIGFGAGKVWATIPGTPLTEIDAVTNQILHRWVGPGGDSLAFGYGAVWVTETFPSV